MAYHHAAMFGYDPTIYMPKPGSKDIYKRLKTQCENMQIRVLPPDGNTSEDLKSALSTSDVVLDAIFGFSFQGPVRAPFGDALTAIAQSTKPIVSVDVPSGWEVDGGRAEGAPALEPDVLVSLTAPKEGVRAFKGRHFLGGRFVTKYVSCSPPRRRKLHSAFDMMC
jgi:NAD(P)H-hydrate epimerase